MNSFVLIFFLILKSIIKKNIFFRETYNKVFWYWFAAEQMYILYKIQNNLLKYLFFSFTRRKSKLLNIYKKHYNNNIGEVPLNLSIQHPPFKFIWAPLCFSLYVSKPQLITHRFLKPMKSTESSPHKYHTFLFTPS